MKDKIWTDVFDGSLDDNVPPPYKTFKLWNSPLNECKVEMIMLDIVFSKSRSLLTFLYSS